MKKKTTTPEAPKVAYLYLRVSTVKQAESGVGIDAQLARCKLHAEKLGLPIAGIFKDEAISGGDGVADRPGLSSLIDAARSTPGAVVIVFSVSRLARSQRLLWTLVDDREGGFGLNISSASEPFDCSTSTGRAFLGMLAIFSQLELEMGQERSRAAMQVLRDRGTRLGARNSIELGGSEIIRKIKDMYAEGNGGYSLRALADKLNADGVPTVTGRGKWHFRTVQNAVKMNLGE